MQAGNEGLGRFVADLGTRSELSVNIAHYGGRVNQILGIRDINFHIDAVTGIDKSNDEVVDIFNRVNSGGTKLSKGEFALAKICADWPDARVKMREALRGWHKSDYHFDLDWLLRCVNTIVTGEAKFSHLHSVDAERVGDGLDRAERAVDYPLNLIAGRLGLDHDRVFFGRYALPVLAHYLDRRGGRITDPEEQDRLLFWYVQSAMWGRYSGSTESVIDKDLRAVENLDGGLDRLIAELRVWRGDLRVVHEHFRESTIGARFYPVLYMLTRVGEARDWGTGLPLKRHLLGKMSRLEVHHIFPKNVLYRAGYGRREVDAVANFCLLTKDTNLQIGARPPAEYFREIEANHPGALATQWVPDDPALWEVDRYADFLEARRSLLAAAANRFLVELSHGLVEQDMAREMPAEVPVPAQQVEEPIPGGVDSDEEEQRLLDLNCWVIEQNLPEGELLYELADPETGAPVAVLDLAWPNGLQEGFSAPVAVLLDEPAHVHAAANAHGLRYFTSVEGFRRYVLVEVLGEPGHFDG